MSLINTLLTKKLSQEGVDDTATGVDPEKRDDTAAPAPAPEAPAAVAPATEPAPVEPAQAAPATPEGEASTTPEVAPADPVAVSDPVADPVVDPVDPATTDPVVGDGTDPTEPVVDPADPAAPAVDPVDPTGEPAPVEGEPTEPLDQLPEPGAESDLTPEAQAAAEEGDDLEVDSDTDTEEDLEAKADEVAEYTEASQSLEEIAATIEETLNDGGMTPEAVTLAQGSVNDILDDVGEEPIGLPSQESFTTFVGRQQNTRLVMESIGEKAKELAGKAWQMLLELIKRAKEALGKIFAKNKKDDVTRYSARVSEAVKKHFQENPNVKLVFPISGLTAASCRFVATGVVDVSKILAHGNSVLGDIKIAQTWLAGAAEGKETTPPDTFSLDYSEKLIGDDIHAEIGNLSGFIKLLNFCNTYGDRVLASIKSIDVLLAKLEKVAPHEGAAANDIKAGVIKLHKVCNCSGATHALLEKMVCYNWKSADE